MKPQAAFIIGVLVGYFVVGHALTEVMGLVNRGRGGR